MIATKEQERKALEQIKKIIAGLGEDSYVGTAMQGMIEDAEDNIKNDWAMSWKDRAEENARTANGWIDRFESMKQSRDNCKARIEELEEENEKLRAAVMSVGELGDIAGLIADHRYICHSEERRLAELIVEYADEPQGAAFKEAVAENRRAAASEEKCRLVLEMLCKYEENAGKL